MSRYITAIAWLNRDDEQRIFTRGLRRCRPFSHLFLHDDLYLFDKLDAIGYHVTFNQAGYHLHMD